MQHERLYKRIHTPTWLLGLLAASLPGCSEPQPRTFADFIEDTMAMQGTLARCNEDREGTLNDLECANARRAAATLALRIEQARREELERESERKLAELRAELVRREQAEREALAAVEAAKRAAYEAQWSIDVTGRKTLPPIEGAAESGSAPSAALSVLSPGQVSAAAPAPPPAIPRPFREAEPAPQ